MKFRGMPGLLALLAAGCAAPRAGAPHSNPVPIPDTLASGDVVRAALPVEPWLAGRRTQTIDIDAPARVTRVDIDPDRWYPDAHRRNNAWVRP